MISTVLKKVGKGALIVIVTLAGALFVLSIGVACWAVINPPAPNTNPHDGPVLVSSTSVGDVYKQCDKTSDGFSGGGVSAVPNSPECQ